MSFFKKLKERLFTLDPDRKNTNVKVKTNLDIVSKETKKVEQKAHKELLKAKKKAHKIDKYVAGLDKSGTSFSRRIKEIQSRYNQIDEEFFEELEEILIMADISAKLVWEIIEEIKNEVRIENVTDPKLIAEIIADKIFVIYANKSILDTTLNIQDKRKNVILVVGVNGAGKTTTIAKLAHKYKLENKKVLIAAGDTFRAGAVEQLAVWAKRVNADLVRAQKANSDPGAVVFQAIQKLKNEDYDLLIIDTAGRLQNKINLMQELAKINKIIKREIPEAPHESLLVLDATTGQNGVSQAKHFKDVTPLSGIVLTKMDGTSKGGIVLTIKDELELAVKFIGLGEQIDDLQEFDLDAFIYGMTKELMPN